MGCWVDLPVFASELENFTEGRGGADPENDKYPMARETVI